MTQTRSSLAEEIRIRREAAERNEAIVRQLLAGRSEPVGYRESVAVQYVAAYLANYQRRPYAAYRLLRMLKARPLPGRLVRRLWLYQVTRSHRMRSRRILAAYAREAPPGPRVLAQTSA